MLLQQIKNKRCRRVVCTAMLRASRFSFCGSYERCFFCGVRVCVPSSTQFCQTERFYPTLALGFKRFRAAHQAAVQHHHRTSHRLIYMGAPVFPLCDLRHPRISSLPHLEGETCSLCTNMQGASRSGRFHPLRSLTRKNGLE